MEIAKIVVDRTSGIARNRVRIPAGAAGLKVAVVFTDPVWDRLEKTVVFRGNGSKIAEFDGETAIVPWEVLENPGPQLWFGIWGSDPDTGLQLPLIEVRIGPIEDATDPTADPGTDPTLPIWAQLQAEISDLRQNGVSEETIAQMVANYLAENPPTVTETDPTVPAWAKQAEKPSYTADEVGALSQDALTGAVNDALSQAKASGQFDGDDYVLTKEDKNEIAKMASELVEIPESSGGTSDDGELFTVVAEGGEQWIGFTYEELGISSLIDIKAIQIFGYNLQYLHESTQGAQYVFLKEKPEWSAAYGYITYNLYKPKAASNYEEGGRPGRNAFVSTKAEYPRRITTEEYTAEPPMYAIGSIQGRNTKESTQVEGKLVIPTDYLSWYGGTGIWMGLPDSTFTWANGATFGVKIWRW